MVVQDLLAAVVPIYPPSQSHMERSGFLDGEQQLMGGTWARLLGSTSTSPSISVPTQGMKPSTQLVVKCHCAAAAAVAAATAAAVAAGSRGPLHTR